jgi:hypothetical protein
MRVIPAVPGQICVTGKQTSLQRELAELGRRPKRVKPQGSIFHAILSSWVGANMQVSRSLAARIFDAAERAGLLAGGTKFTGPIVFDSTNYAKYTRN